MPLSIVSNAMWLYMTVPRFADLDIMSGLIMEEDLSYFIHPQVSVYNANISPNPQALEPESSHSAQ